MRHWFHIDPYANSIGPDVCENCGMTVDVDGPDEDGRQAFVDANGSWDCCATCGGAGVVAVAGPDENGQYDTDDCPDCSVA